MRGRIARVLAVGLAAAGAVLASLVAASAADRDSPIVSGLPWRSGASCADATYAAWRGGRRLDANVAFFPAASWAAMEDEADTSSFRGRVGLSPQLVVSLPMMPKTAPKQHAACARGDFDDHFRRIGAALADAGAGRALIRLGWEYNRGSGSHPWGIDTAGEIPAYVACFRREAEALEVGRPRAQDRVDQRPLHADGGVADAGLPRGRRGRRGGHPLLRQPELPAVVPPRRSGTGSRP